MGAILLTIGIIVGFLLLCFLTGYLIAARWAGIMDYETFGDKLILTGVGFLILVFIFTVVTAILGIYTLVLHILH